MLGFSLIFTCTWLVRGGHNRGGLSFAMILSAPVQVFGDMFLHGGKPAYGPPKYIDTDELLSAPTVDPYIPLR